MCLVNKVLRIVLPDMVDLAVSEDLPNSQLWDRDRLRASVAAAVIVNISRTTGM